MPWELLTTYPMHFVMLSLFFTGRMAFSNAEKTRNSPQKQLGGGVPGETREGHACNWWLGKGCFLTLPRWVEFGRKSRVEIVDVYTPTACLMGVLMASPWAALVRGNGVAVGEILTMSMGLSESRGGCIAVRPKRDKLGVGRRGTTSAIGAGEVARVDEPVEWQYRFPGWLKSQADRDDSVQGEDASGAIIPRRPGIGCEKIQHLTELKMR
ncbi:hypothetical protein OG21DRAFT_1527391 [Imleria badia]|nr:hypothetical protein OG21DRAFT_1527391 [Imleria badia]